MKKLFTVVFLLCMVAMMSAQQSPPKPAANAGEVLDRQLSNLEKEFVSAAEAMPADKYDFAPTSGEFKGVRTFGEQVKHVASTNNGISAALLGDKMPFDYGKGDNGPENLKTKDQIIQYLKDSFAKAHQAVVTLNNSNVVEQIDGPFGGKSARLGAATAFLWHSFDHYGQMVEYLRMNSIIPPASRQ